VVNNFCSDLQLEKSAAYPAQDTTKFMSSNT